MAPSTGVNIVCCSVITLHLTRSISPPPPVVTPALLGRLVDHLTACDTFSLRRVRFLVLDEADRLIAGRFDSDLATIMSALPQKRQTLLFSATCNDTLRQLESIANNEVTGPGHRAAAGGGDGCRLRGIITLSD